MGVEFDMSQVRALVADMRQVDGRMAIHLLPVMERGANRIKQQLQSEMRQSRHFRGAASAITYEKDHTPGMYGFKIGPEKGRPGSLANIAYFGTSRGGGTVPDPGGALEAEAPVLLSHLGRVASEVALS